ncbi:hypothetical protein A6C57_28185 (plasmid) [Fibrella sp. ES10-3-2-2]
MTIYLKHQTANFYYALDLDTQQVEMCCTVAGRERVERYEGGSGALQKGNSIIAEQEYNDIKQFALRRLGLASLEPEETVQPFQTINRNAVLFSII